VYTKLLSTAIWSVPGKQNLKPLYFCRQWRFVLARASGAPWRSLWIMFAWDQDDGSDRLTLLLWFQIPSLTLGLLFVCFAPGHNVLPLSLCMKNLRL
jgi:hypothetical protein